MGGRTVSHREDPNSFDVKPKSGGTLVCWRDDADEPLRFWLGPAGSRDIRVEGEVYDAEGAIARLVHAYRNAPWDYGTTDAADKYQEVLERVAKTMGQSVAHLLATYAAER